MWGYTASTLKSIRYQCASCFVCYTHSACVLIMFFLSNCDPAVALIDSSTDAFSSVFFLIASIQIYKNYRVNVLKVQFFVMSAGNFGNVRREGETERGREGERERQLALDAALTR